MGGGSDTQHGLIPKLILCTLLSPSLSSKERLDEHIVSMILATEWRMEVAQLQVCNKAGIEKNRSMKSTRSEGLRGNVLLPRPPSAFNSKMDF